MKSMKKFLKSKGFTLIELMIVVAIIGILAAIAIPNFIRYQLKSKTTEAKTVLGGVKTSQEAYRAELDNYAFVTSINPTALPGTVKTNWDTTQCQTTCSRSAPSLCNRFDCIGYSPSGLVYFQYESPARAAVGATTAEFGAGARGNLDGDATNSGFAFRSSNQTNTTMGLVGDNISQCVTAVEGGIIHDCRPGQY